MMQKKGVVLLITLLFITAISILTYKNLDDANNYIKKSNHNTSLTQLSILTNNLKSQIQKYLQTNKKHILDFEEGIDYTDLSFPIESIDTTIDIVQINSERYNLNNLLKKDPDTKEFEKLFDKHLVPNFYIFHQQILKTKLLYNIDALTSFKQIQAIIKAHKKETNDDSIEQIEEYFSYFDVQDDTKLLQCSLTITQDDLTAYSTVIYDIKDDAKVVDFELYFK